MADVATLGIRVEADKAVSDVERYDRALDSATARTERFEAKTKSLSETMVRSSRAGAEAARRSALEAVRVTQATFENDIARIREAQLRGYLSPKEAAQQGRIAAQEYNDAVLRTLDEGRNAGAFRGAVGQEAFTEVAGSIKNIDEGARRATGGVGRLNNALVTMARRATGTNAVVGQLVDVIGTFAIGTARMVPILAGLAAIGFAWQRITRDSREAREELERNLETLTRVREEQDVAARGGEVQIAVEAARDRSRAIAADLQVLVDASRLGERERLGTLEARTRLTRELAETNELIRRGEQRLREERERDSTEDIQARTRAAEAQAAEIASGLNERAVAAQAERDLIRVTTEFELEQRRRAAETVRTGIERTLGEELERRREVEEEKTRISAEAEAERTRIAREEARARARAEIEEQRRIRAFAQGLNIIGGAVGGSVGGALQGAAGGALTGSALGSAIPGVGNVAGAVVGGLIGAAGSLFGASRQAREAARIAREAALLEAQALAQRRRNIDEDLNIRGIALGGDSGAVQLATLRAQQRRELENQDLTPSQRETLEFLQGLETAALERNLAAERQIRLAEDHLDVLDDQLSEQRRTVDTLRNVVDNLSEFSGGLSLGSFSPLGPSARLEEARRQFEALRGLALGGDVSAAESLPDAARRLLEASRAFNASGAGFVSDFARVRETIDLVRDRFADQLSVEERMLAELEAQRQAAEDALQAIRDETEEANRRAAEAFAQRQRLEEEREAREREREEREREDRLPKDDGDDETRDAIDRLRDAVEEGLNDVVRANDRVREAVRREETEKDPIR